jgi:hypothetical protein
MLALDQLSGTVAVRPVADPRLVRHIVTAWHASPAARAIEVLVDNLRSLARARREVARAGTRATRPPAA